MASAGMLAKQCTAPPLVARASNFTTGIIISIQINFALFLIICKDALSIYYYHFKEHISYISYSLLVSFY